MSLTRITLTGVDQFTDRLKLFTLSQKYPIVEWGILYNFYKKDNYRYPNHQFVRDIPDFFNCRGMKSSIHFCKNSALDIISRLGIEHDKDLNLVQQESFNLANRYSRIQLNFNALEDKVWATDIDNLMKRLSNKSVITQFNSNNRHITSQITASNHSVLFDQSLGKGIKIRDFDYLVDKSFGYAGGFSIDNLKELFPRMLEASKGKDFWIDMESSLRTDNKFDTSKAEAVLQLVTNILQSG